MSGNDTINCDNSRIQLNTAKLQMEQARSQYLTCQPPDVRASMYIDENKAALDQARTEADQLSYVGKFMLRQAAAATDPSGLDMLVNYTESAVIDMENEIEALKGQIRTQRRIFLDSAPSVSPAVAGLYFTKVPDNQVLIAFMSTLGGLLIMASVIIYMRILPFQYFQNLDLLAAGASNERVKLIATMWVAVVIVSYIGLYVFT